MTKMTIRKMELKDLDQVYHVDLASFSAPWKRKTYELELTENSFAHYFVVETEDAEIVGYVGLWLIMEDAQITNIAVHPKYRGYKIGEKLFGFAKCLVFPKLFMLSAFFCISKINKTLSKCSLS